MVSEPQRAPYGAWKSPITAEQVVVGSVRPGQIAIDQQDVYWTEQRPIEGGRTALVRYTGDGYTTDAVPPAFNVRSRVHEYGGGAYTVHQGTIYFSHFLDNRLYRQDRGAHPRPITSAGPIYYADIVVDHQRGRLLCVREDPTAVPPANALVALDSSGVKAARVLAEGNDFYASPTLSPDGSRLAWLTWNHPNLPWDGTLLQVAELAADGSLVSCSTVAGGEEESIFQPVWSPAGDLYFVSDRSGWWNLYRLRDGQVEPLHPMEAEFGLPQWVFGMSTYAFESESRLVCAFCEQGIWRLATLDVESRAFEPLDLPFTYITQVRAMPGRAIFEGSSPTEEEKLVMLDLKSGEYTTARRAGEREIEHDLLSMPRTISFPADDGHTAHAFFYPPHNRDFVAPEGERPPLIVISHGGPTAASSNDLSLKVQYWTSRGIAVLDVNYGGSTGYGRGYRERLNEQWGIVDVSDCINGVRSLVAEGAVDENRVAIRGGSAGGYTTLCALTFHDVFKAGAVYYGIGDLELLLKDTHKFESRYLERLIGPYPEQKDRYLERSPIHAAERLTCPVIFFQGLEDKVVPPSQSETMVAALREKGVPVAYLPFAGEQHGFRRAENIRRSLEAELYFYAQVFGFRLADEIEPVEIENM